MNYSFKGLEQKYNLIKEGNVLYLAPILDTATYACFHALPWATKGNSPPSKNLGWYHTEGEAKIHGLTLKQFIEAETAYTPYIAVIEALAPGVLLRTIRTPTEDERLGNEKIINLTARPLVSLYVESYLLDISRMHHKEEQNKTLKHFQKLFSDIRSHEENGVIRKSDVLRSLVDPLEYIKQHAEALKTTKAGSKEAGVNLDV